MKIRVGHKRETPLLVDSFAKFGDKHFVIM